MGRAYPDKITIKQILKWADEYHDRTGEWPKAGRGLVRGGGGRTWDTINETLRRAYLSDRGYRSLFDLLKKKRGLNRYKRTLPDLTKSKVLAFADAHYKRHGEWPTVRSPPIPSKPSISWYTIQSYMYGGKVRGVSGMTLARFLWEERNHWNFRGKPCLTQKTILVWADEHHRRTGKWPNLNSGRVKMAPQESWPAISAALHEGCRGLSGGETLYRLLVRKRNTIHPAHKPKISIKNILEWADEHHTRTGQWPKTGSGLSPSEEKLFWASINNNLSQGKRGLPGGTTLRQLLHKRRGVPYQTYKREYPPLTLDNILEWADNHQTRTGQWPKRNSGAVRDPQNLCWNTIEVCLAKGGRGLPGGTTLLRVLAEYRNVPNRTECSPLSVTRILELADDHHARTGKWPKGTSCAVLGAKNLSWGTIANRLARGGRGLPGGTTLPELLAKHRGVLYRMGCPRLSIRKILECADAFHRRTGQWPTLRSGPVKGVPQTTWLRVNDALHLGNRGLPGGSSLLKVLSKHRGVRHKHFPPPLTIEQILGWADAHHQRTGQWPTLRSGAIPGVISETWCTINIALFKQKRGLKGYATLLELLVRHRGVRSGQYAPKLTLKKILDWADVFYAQTGTWPTKYCRPDPPEPGESWLKIFAAMSVGGRGLGKKTLLTKLLRKERMPEFEQCLTPLFPDSILEWAADHHELYGKLPTPESGPVRGMDGEHWPAIDASLNVGTRTRPGGSSLKEFLRGHYEKPWPGIGRKLTEERILKWADSFRERVGTWPTRKSAYTDPSRTERWATIDLCLQEGHRGLPGGSSLHKLLSENRFGE